MRCTRGCSGYRRDRADAVQSAVVGSAPTNHRPYWFLSLVGGIEMGLEIWPKVLMGWGGIGLR